MRANQCIRHGHFLRHPVREFEHEGLLFVEQLRVDHIGGAQAFDGLLTHASAEGRAGTCASNS